MNTIYSLQLKAARSAALLIVAAVLALSAAAQSTGNPKGSVSPPTSDAQKAPASRGPTTGFGDSGKIVTDEETVKSRTQTTKSPTKVGPARSTPDGTPGRSSSGSAAQGTGPAAKPAP